MHNQANHNRILFKELILVKTECMHQEKEGIGACGREWSYGRRQGWGSNQGLLDSFPHDIHFSYITDRGPNRSKNNFSGWVEFHRQKVLVEAARRRDDGKIEG